MKWKSYGEDDHLAMELTPNFNEYPGGFLIDPDASGTEQFGLGIGQYGSRNNAFFTRPSAEAWHYYAFTFDTTASGAQEIKPYVDGRAVSFTKSAEGTGAGNFAKAMLYWMSRDASTLFGAGSMQDVALYDTTLSADTIGEHYELGEVGTKASFASTPVVATAGVPVRLDASVSSSELGSITDYAWDFDGSKSYSTDGGGSATISHTFSAPGTYTVDLRVKDSLGVTATVSHTITVGAALGQYEQAVEKTPDVAHFWPMGESSGSSFADVLDGANASLMGGVSVGELGGLVDDSSTSAAFNGSTGAAHAEVNLSGTHKLTVEFWMKWTSYAEDDHLALEFTPNFNEYAGGFLVDPDASPGTDFAASIGEGSSRNTVYFERPSAGAWHYYTFVLNTEAPAETEITPYVDGHAVSYTKTVSGTGAGAFANSTLYWMSRDASTLFGKGSMQDLALYETALESGTILEHYEHGKNTYYLANTTAPSVEGVVNDGATVTADPGAWSGATPIAYAYQWQSCNSDGGACEDIEGATAQHDTISSADLETTLRVIVTATNPGGSLRVTSAASAEIEAGAPVELEAPSVSGTPAGGETLQANAGVWGGTETEVSYQWERCNSSGGECADIVGATESGYTLVEGDVGKTLRIRVGVSNALGSLTAVSPPSPEIEATAATLVNTWAPSISGTPQGGQTLMVNVGSWLGTSMIGYLYQWERCNESAYDCEAIEYAAWPAYAPEPEDIGYTLRARVTAAEASGTASQTTPATATIAAEGAPTIEEPPVTYGTGLVGYTLTASVGAWSGEGPISYAYQWQRCNEKGESCSSISGATASSYTLTGSDVSSTLRVLVTATDGGGSTTGASAPTTVVSPTTLVDVSAPSISGPHELGRALSADPGIWTAAGPIAFSYQWKRCNEHGESCSSISGATEPTYTPTGSDVGNTIEVLVTATGTSGADSVASAPTPVIVSEPIAPINVIAPAIEGNLTAGDTLTAEPGTWLGSEPITYSYQWQKCDEEGEACTNISGATAGTYTLPEGDVGSTIRVTVTASNTLGNTSVTSAQTETIGAPGPPANTEAPQIQGTAQQGQRLFAGNGVWSGSRPLSFYYHWERCNEKGESCAAIEGATKPSYTLASADVASTLRLKVTVSNSLGSAAVYSATTAVVASSSEASVSEAIELAQSTDPSVIAKATSATLEEEAIKPAVSDTEEALSSEATLAGSSASKETPGEFAVSTSAGELSLAPIGTASNATAPTIVNGTAAVYAGTSAQTDTIVRPEPLGATTLLQLRSSQAPTTFSWEVRIGAEQELQKLENGSVAVVEKESGSYLEGELGSELFEGKGKEATAETEEHGYGSEGADEEFGSSLEEVGQLEHLPAAPTTSTTPMASKEGELHPQETQPQYESGASALSYAESHASGKTLMVVEPPTVMDAAGHTVPASLSVEGNALKMTLTPSEETTYPATAAVAVVASSSKKAAPPPEAHRGLSEQQKSGFDESEDEGKELKEFDPRLKSHLKVESGRLILNYNASPHSQLLHEWLEAVQAAHLKPFITFRTCEPEPPNYGTGKNERVPCPIAPSPTSPSFPHYYYNHVYALMKELIKDGVRTFGAWNEPDNASSPLLHAPEQAALLWGEAERAIEHLGCGRHCIVVAGEFTSYEGHYIGQYVNTILRDAKRGLPTRTKATFWGIHDYGDLLNVEAEKQSGQWVIGRTYRNFEADDYVRYIKSKRMGSTHVWLSEQGVQIESHVKPGRTRLTGNSELQRLAAKDFLLLGDSSMQVERIYYYGYKGVSKARKEELAAHKPEAKYEFDSALLAGEGYGSEPQDWRPAYCVLALGEEGCPPAVVTQAPVAGTTMLSSTTALLSITPGGLPAHYFVEYGTTTAYGHTTSSTAVANDSGMESETVALSGLEPCTTYHYQAEAESSADEGKPVLGGDKTLTTTCLPEINPSLVSMGPEVGYNYHVIETYYGEIGFYYFWPGYTGDWVGDPTSFSYHMQVCPTSAGATGMGYVLGKGGECYDHSEECSSESPIGGFFSPNGELLTNPATGKVGGSDPEAATVALSKCTEMHLGGIPFCEWGMRVAVTATNAYGSTTVYSNLLLPIGGSGSCSNYTPRLEEAPEISKKGPLAIGNSVKVSTGKWEYSPTSYSYQWLRCNRVQCVEIPGATSSTYTTVEADFDHTLDVAVTATNEHGSSTRTAGFPAVWKE